MDIRHESKNHINRSGAGRPIFLFIFQKKIIKNKKKYTLKLPVFDLKKT